MNRRLRSLDQDRPDLAAQWVADLNLPTTPADVTGSSAVRAAWRCPGCGRVYFARISNRVYRGSGCPWCANDARGRAARARQA